MSARHSPVMRICPHTFIPVNHIVLLLFFVGIAFSCILVQVLLLSLPFYRQIMAEFAFFALFTDSLLEINAQNRLRINAERDFLRLDWLKKFSSLSPRSFIRRLFLLALSLLSIFLFLLRGFGGGSLGL